MRNVKLILILTLLGCLVIFSIQNADQLEVHFLIWSFSLRRAVLLFAVFATGLITGWLLRGARRRESPAEDRRFQATAGADVKNDEPARFC